MPLRPRLAPNPMRLVLCLVPCLVLALIAGCSQRPQAFELLTRDCRDNDPILRKVWSGRGEVPTYVAFMCDCMTDHVVTRLPDDQIDRLVSDGQPSAAIRARFEDGRPICLQKALQITMSLPPPMPSPEPRN